CGCAAAQGLARTMVVVPGGIPLDLASHRIEPQGDEDLSRALVLQRPNEPLDHREAAVLPHRAEPVLDAATAAPLMEGSTRELGALIGDQVVRWPIALPAGPLEELPHLRGSRALGKNREPHHGPREMIDDHRQPPAERPALRPCKG